MIDVVIPLGPAHVRYLQESLDSVKLQKFETFTVVVNDTGASLPSYLDTEDVFVIDRHRFSDVPWGPGRGRNIGAMAGKGAALVFLDADDMLIPGALVALWQVYETDERHPIVYGDVLRSDTHTVHRQMEQYCGPDIERTALQQPKRMPTHLIPRWAHEAVGGWREDMPLWEDIEYEARLDAHGVCAVHIDYPVYYYRTHTGSRRVSAEDDKVKQRAKLQIYESLQPYYDGDKTMACGTCGSGSQIPQPPTPREIAMRQSTQLLDIRTMLHQGAELEIEFMFPQREARTYMGPRTGRRYRFAQSVERLRRISIGMGLEDVDPDDAAEMLTWHRDNYRLFRLVTVTPPIAQPTRRPSRKAQETEEAPAAHADRAAMVSTAEQDQMRAEIEALFAEQRRKAQGDQAPPRAEAPKPAPADDGDEPVEIPTDTHSVANFTIQAMRDLLGMGLVDKDDIAAWLREEQSAKSPRVGMIALLKASL